MADRLHFATDAADWPHRSASCLVQADGIDWHVQRMGPEPARGRGAGTLLLLHGTGAATHSWRALMPLLAREHEVVALDLPGHGFSGMPTAWPLTMPRMAEAVARLLAVLRVQPAWLVGHSAGAAIALRLVLDQHLEPRAIVSLNGALLPLGGLAGSFFSPIAKLLALNPLVPRFFAWRASDLKVVQRLLDSTGSEIDEEGRRLYARLVSSPGHAAGALAMMANWDLDALQHDLPRLQVPLHLLVGRRDATVPPAQAARVQRLVPQASCTVLPEVGHLMHEERPEATLEAMRRVMRSARGAADAA